jgi:KDO2-lipid IV(A) lauroyltransferase
MLARQTELPIYGMRVVRKPDRNSFWGEISEPVEPARDADGRIDIKGTMPAAGGRPLTFREAATQ